MRKLLIVGTVIAVLWSIFQLYGAAFGLFHIMIQRPLHVIFALMLTYISYPAWRNKLTHSMIFNYLPTLLALLIGIYVIIGFGRISTRMFFVDKVLNSDIFFGLSMIILILEACRRTTGLALPIIGMIFIAYAFLGPYMPGGLMHRGIPLEYFIDVEFLSAQGLFSEPVGVSAEIVFYFVLFGAFLEKSGAGLLFTDVAKGLTGRTRGGPAKVSVVSSALFGMISGSAVANVVVDGVFTIPMMKKTGFRPHFAAAIEAVASTGGQIMPPIMGAAAFLMADLTGIPYYKIIIHAAIPAILYYIALYFMVDFEAWKSGMKASKLVDLSDIKKGFFQRVHLFFPFFVLIYFIMNVSLMKATLISLLSAFGISFLRKATMMDLEKVIGALEKGAREAIHVAIPSAVAGIMVGIIVYTGIGLKFTGFLIQISGGHLLPALLFTMVGCLILGMGMPTSAAYLLTAVLMAPALITMGLPVLVAHMFVFYFAVLSMITPPVALATFAAASIAESGIWETGLAAFKLAITAFLVPYAFVYNHALLFQGPMFEIAWVSITAAFGVFVLAAAVTGYFYAPINKIERFILLICAILLITPEKITDFLGLISSILIFFNLRKKAQKEKRLQFEINV